MLQRKYRQLSRTKEKRNDRVRERERDGERETVKGWKPNLSLVNSWHQGVKRDNYKAI